MSLPDLSTNPLFHFKRRSGSPFSQSTKDATMPHKDGRRDAAMQSGTFDVYIEIDCDCEELLDAIGLDYEQCKDDHTQNEVKVILNREEFCDVFETIQLAKASETLFATRLLNPELGEYATKVTVYTPYGDRICFS